MRDPNALRDPNAKDLSVRISQVIGSTFNVDLANWPCTFADLLVRINPIVAECVQPARNDPLYAALFYGLKLEVAVCEEILRAQRGVIWSKPLLLVA